MPICDYCCRQFSPLGDSTRSIMYKGNHLAYFYCSIKCYDKHLPNYEKDLPLNDNYIQDGRLQKRAEQYMKKEEDCRNMERTRMNFTNGVALGMSSNSISTNSVAIGYGAGLSRPLPQSKMKTYITLTELFISETEDIFKERLKIYIKEKL